MDGMEMEKMSKKLIKLFSVMKKCLFHHILFFLSCVVFDVESLPGTDFSGETVR